MGARGPVGKRSDQRLGHAHAAAGAQQESATRAPAGEPPTPPVPDPGWHPVARLLYESLPVSGQAAFYEASDYAVAYLVCESLSRDLKPRYVGLDGNGQPIERRMPLTGASLTGYLRALDGLLATEGARRRVHLELQRAPTEPEAAHLAAVDRLDDRRSRMERGSGG